MRSSFWLCVAVVLGAVALAPARVDPLLAQARDAVALTGQVTSADEGAMEGVLVSAKKVNATMTTTVVTDQQGRYRFPESRLEPGSYAVRIRATGWDLEHAAAVDVDEHKTWRFPPFALHRHRQRPAVRTDSLDRQRIDRL